MVTLREVTGRVWDFISPRKTQKRRDKPFKAPAPVRPRDTSSPAADTKVAQWKDQIATPDSSHATAAADAVMLPPSPPMSVQPAPSVEPAMEYESDDAIRASVEESPVGGSVDDAWDANEDTVLADDSEFLEQRKRTNVQRERVKQEVQGRELREAGWPEDAVFLFQKLNMRGFEPLMPQGWAKDFESLPWDLFTLNDNIAFIKPDSGSDFRGAYECFHLSAESANLFISSTRSRRTFHGRRSGPGCYFHKSAFAYAGISHWRRNTEIQSLGFEGC